MIKKIVKLHNFFVQNSPEYIGEEVNYNLHKYKLSTKQKIYYPIAYLKFMYFGVVDIIKR